MYKERNYKLSLDKFRIALWYFEKINDQNQILFIIKQISQLKDALKAPKTGKNKLIDYSTLEEEEEEDKEERKKELIIKNLMTAGQKAKELGKIEVALQNYNEGISIALKEEDYVIMAKCITRIAELYRDWGKYDDAVEQYKCALQIQEDIGDNQKVVQILNEIGDIYNLWGQYNKSFEYYHKLLKIQRNIGDKNGMGESLTDIGHIYREWGRYHDAYNLYSWALRINREVGYLVGIALNLNNIGNIYEAMGQYDEALKFYNEALEIQENIGATKSLSDILKNIGTVKRKRNNFKSALFYHKKALKIAQNLKEIRNNADYLYELGCDHRETGENTKAIEYFKLAFSEYRKILLETPKEHLKTFIKQITHLLNLITHIEFLLKISQKVTLTSIKRDAKDILKILVEKKNGIIEFIKALKRPINPQKLIQDQFGLTETEQTNQFNSLSGYKYSPHQQYQKNLAILTQNQFKTLVKCLDNLSRIEVKFKKYN
ncbi:MAG: tetratricopeptide repeat protein [Promethearchaeota archaeon]